ncbi:hypothetical protein AJ79_07944 [Helicocarpus griseus UAMH5409]|uniref:Uncharacterized protein n=1 Tax=Helicocarpus griseus UAMH5409 TaxID=1447875 RepID=A0A2B7WXL5_9EURO|nr:hypothetical protein AJ79_07944 [Helicocarpus griseus UAMH5409]
MAANRLIPLLILFIVVGVLAVIGFVTWSIMMEVKAQTKKEMEKKHVTMSRDGMKVGYRELNDEQYKDISQSVLVSIWNNRSLPAVKKRWWGGSNDSDKE